jgi:hypothetical protein
MLQQGFRRQRQPHRRLYTELQPEESLRRHADDPRRHAIDQERRSDTKDIEEISTHVHGLHDFRGKRIA